MGTSPASWYSPEEGLFSPESHLCLMENFWVEEQSVAINRYIIVDAATAEVTLHFSTMKAYTEPELKALLEEIGFRDVQVYDSLAGEVLESEKHLMVIAGRK